MARSRYPIRPRHFQTGLRIATFGSFASAAEVEMCLPRRRRSEAMFSPILYVVPIVLIVAVYLVAVSVRILREYERAVVFTLGRFQRSRGPALCC